MPSPETKEHMPRCAGPCGEAPGLIGQEGEWGGSWTKAFSGFSPGKERPVRVNSLGLASSNDSDDLWATGVVSGCLGPGLWMI